MLSRRGFLGALTAILAAPRALYAGTVHKLYRPDYRYTTTFVDSSGETMNKVQYRGRVYFKDSQPFPETEPRHERDDNRG